jgi:hypothetical protein
MRLSVMRHALWFDDDKQQQQQASPRRQRLFLQA